MGRPFLLGVIVTLVGGAVLATALGALVIWSGLVDVAATNAGGFPDKILAYASYRSIRHHATDERNPLARKPAALETGMDHYREMCVTCHGGPGTVPSELAAGLHPAAPDLASAEVQSSFTDGMLYETIARGIGSTGMPGFSSTHQPQQIWAIVAFVRHLTALTPEEKKELATPAPPEGAEDGSEGAKPAEAAAAPAAEAASPEHLHRVTISSFKFDPPKLEVHEGDTVVWVNTDFVAHTATADDHSFDTDKIDGSKSKEVVLRKKGTFPYFCRYHSSMRGVVTVQ